MTGLAAIPAYAAKGTSFSNAVDRVCEITSVSAVGGKTAGLSAKDNFQTVACGA